MTIRLFFLFLILIITAAGPAIAKEIRLKKGEVYRDHNLSVICEGDPAKSSTQSIAIQECQYWDNYQEKCLFTKTIYTYNDLICVEECQQWDSYRRKCDYQNKCIFHPSQEVFVLKTCSDFDSYNHNCRNIKEEIIGR